MVQSTNRRKLISGFWLILFAFPGILCSQELIEKSLVHKDFRYNDIEVSLGDSVSQSGFIEDIKNDSLIILSEGIRKAIPSSDIGKVTFNQPTNRNGSIWSGLFLGMYLGNVLFYQSDNFYYGVQDSEEPFALATRDYPRGMGAISVNAFFGLVGMTIMYIFTPAESDKTFKFENDQSARQDQWEKFYKYLTGVKATPDSKVHFVLTMGRLFNRVLDPYTDGDRQLVGSQRITGYLNFIRKIQLSVNVTKKIRVGASVFFEGEPSVVGLYWNETNRENAITARYDARGYYGIVSYTLLSRDVIDKFEVVVGAGIGQIIPDFRLTHSEYFYGGNQFRKIVYTTPQVAGILFAELHFHLTDHFSLMYTMDYGQSSEITIEADVDNQIPEQKFSFGNSSFGFGIGFHF